MSDTWTMGMCNEKSGFLFRHECQQYPQNVCALCNKPICEEHTRLVEGQNLCPDCERKKTGNQASPNDPNRRYRDDPYYHSSTYYYGYGSSGMRRRNDVDTHRSGQAGDPNDFHAGDAESLRAEGDEEFETDMNES